MSVTNKDGLVEFCRVLQTLQIEILSTGGTAKVLRENGIPTVDVSEYTGSPEVMDGRLKTIHPKIEGGILAIRSNPQHQKDMAALGIKPIDLVVVNLYEFEKTRSKPDVKLHELIENIDIGGPTMLRAAAKNYQDVTVVIDPADYSLVSRQLMENEGQIDVPTNFSLAVKVFQQTARYDSLIAETLYEQLVQKDQQPNPVIYPPTLNLTFSKIQDLRYGENPHQSAAYYRDANPLLGSMATAHQLQGKELSYNNILDSDAALQLVSEFEEPAVVIIKHTNPCGAALGQTLQQAFIKARDGDPVSAFGGIIAMNRLLDVATATLIAETFFECIIAPGFHPEALKVLSAKKQLRLLSIDQMPALTDQMQIYRRVSGGLLVQNNDAKAVDFSNLSVPTKRKPTNNELQEMAFAWKICRHVKSNAIVYTKDRQLLGAGAGQMSRVDSVRIGAFKSKISLQGAVVASDAFFPFRDGVDEAAKHGIVAVVQPGGSVKDAEVIAAADDHGLAMVFTGVRHFRH